MNPAISPLCVITDTAIQSRFSHIELANATLKAGAKLIQFRDKQLDDSQFLRIAKELRALCQTYDAKLIINDRVKTALQCNADGVHLGQGDMPIQNARKCFGPNKVIGASASSLQEAKQAYEDGASYLGFGHIFPTSTKHKPMPALGLELITAVKATIPIPVMAIGGITKQNVSDVLNAGADNVAVVSAICSAKSPEHETRAFLEVMSAFG